jgi:hypothetical protein
MCYHKLNDDRLYVLRKHNAQPSIVIRPILPGDELSLLASEITTTTDKMQGNRMDSGFTGIYRIGMGASECHYYPLSLNACQGASASCHILQDTYE